MSFIDNSGDIILDVVLTDLGRLRLASGNGFTISKFALGDDEINYERYYINHPSGSAYSDLELLQTPILEAFTNNSVMLNSRLITLDNDDLLYLPVLKVNSLVPPHELNTTLNSYIVAVSTDTLTALNPLAITGLLDGTDPLARPNSIRIDQGLDTTSVDPTRSLTSFSQGLKETSYILEIDNRLGSIVDETNGIIAPLSYVDDDDIAFYTVSQPSTFVSDNTVTSRNPSTETISGPRGTILKFKINSNAALSTDDYLFDTIGTTRTVSGVNLKIIYSFVRVTGINTGYRLDIPVIYVKSVW